MNRRSLSFLVLAALVSGPGLAQSETSAELPRYDVEVVIFKNIQVPKSREFVLPVSSPAKDKKMIDLSSARSVKAAKKLGYVIIPGDQYRLTDVANKLVKSSRYELLLHTAWRQPGLEQERALPVWIRGGRIYGNEYTSIDSQIKRPTGLPTSSMNRLLNRLNCSCWNSKVHNATRGYTNSRVKLRSGYHAICTLTPILY
jgi:hypothetical protein